MRQVVSYERHAFFLPRSILFDFSRYATAAPCHTSTDRWQIERTKDRSGCVWRESGEANTQRIRLKECDGTINTFPAPGPLHMLFPPPSMCFTLESAWLPAPLLHSCFCSNILFREAFLNHRRCHYPLEELVFPHSLNHKMTLCCVLNSLLVCLSPLHQEGRGFFCVT